MKEFFDELIFGIICGLGVAVIFYCVDYLAGLIN